MLYFNGTYKQTWAYLILGAYLIGCLSLPVFEGVHFVLHLGDDSQLHSFAGHQSTHGHAALDLLNDLVDSNSSQLPADLPNEQKVKSLVQICQWQKLDIQFCPIKSYKGYFYLKKPHHTPFQPITAPPPQV